MCSSLSAASRGLIRGTRPPPSCLSALSGSLGKLHRGHFHGREVRAPGGVTHDTLGPLSGGELRRNASKSPHGGRSLTGKGWVRVRRARGRHRVSDIAAQAGLSRATVDRVLHGREGVRPETVAQVERALDELDRQHDAGRALGRVAIFDLVMQSPYAVRLGDPVGARGTSCGRCGRRCCGPARTCTSRSTRRPRRPPCSPDRRRGSDGVILKAPDHPLVVGGRRRGWRPPGSRWSRSSPTCRRAAGSRTSGSTTGRPAPPPPT